MGMNVAAAVASTATVDPLFSLLVGAFGAALLTVSGGLLGAWIQSIREHRKWLREKRFEAYRDFVINMSQISDLMNPELVAGDAEKARAKLAVWVDEITRSSEAVSMLGPRAVNAAGQDWFGAATTMAGNPTKANREAMSRGRWQFLIAVGKELGSKNVGATPPTARPL